MALEEGLDVQEQVCHLVVLGACPNMVSRQVNTVELGEDLFLSSKAHSRNQQF